MFLIENLFVHYLNIKFVYLSSFISKIMIYVIFTITSNYFLKIFLCFLFIYAYNNIHHYIGLSLTTLYSNFFHFKSSNGSFEKVWPKSKHWFLETHAWTKPYMVPNAKVMNTKFVALIKFYIWSNCQIFFWKSLNHSILNFERIHNHASVFGTLDGLEWKSHEYQYCSTHQNLHLIYRPFCIWRSVGKV